MKKISNFDENQLVISHELLQLLAWLCEKEQESLKKLVTKAMTHGLSDRIHSIPKNLTDHDFEHLQQNITDFFGLLEILLVEVGQEDEVKSIVERGLLPALDQIDTSICDKNTVALSVAKATALGHKNQSKEFAKQTLFKEILKRWKPVKKLECN